MPRARRSRRPPARRPSRRPASGRLGSRPQPRAGDRRTGRPSPPSCAGSRRWSGTARAAGGASPPSRPTSSRGCRGGAPSSRAGHRARPGRPSPPQGRVAQEMSPATMTASSGVTIRSHASASGPGCPVQPKRSIVLPRVDGRCVSPMANRRMGEASTLGQTAACPKRSGDRRRLERRFRSPTPRIATGDRRQSPAAGSSARLPRHRAVNSAVIPSRQSPADVPWFSQLACADRSSAHRPDACPSSTPSAGGSSRCSDATDGTRPRSRCSSRASSTGSPTTTPVSHTWTPGRRGSPLGRRSPRKSASVRLPSASTATPARPVVASPSSGWSSGWSTRSGGHRSSSASSPSGTRRDGQRPSGPAAAFGSSSAGRGRRAFKCGPPRASSWPRPPLRSTRRSRTWWPPGSAVGRWPRWGSWCRWIRSRCSMSTGCTSPSRMDGSSPSSPLRPSSPGPGGSCRTSSVRRRPRTGRPSSWSTTRCGTPGRSRRGTAQW